MTSARNGSDDGAPNSEDYTLPPIELLDDPIETSPIGHEAATALIARTVEEALSALNVLVRIVSATRGPMVTQVEIGLLDPMTRMQKVEGLEKDLEMKLGIEGVRVVTPLPNRTTIGIEVPNRTKDAVSMRTLVKEIDVGSMALPIVIGRDVVGRPMVGDLAKMPHLLITGGTGMGKSVCMNALICSILLFKRPDAVKFIMVDPKVIELAWYDDIPHLLAPPITEMAKALAALEWICRTMDERCEVLKRARARNIAAYNELTDDELRYRLAKQELKPEEIPTNGVRMPYIVVIIDEVSELLKEHEDAEEMIERLTLKSRVCGIHLVLSTMYVSSDVITDRIRSGMPSRICYRVSDKSKSRLVLETFGAEKLLVDGDYMFLGPGSSDPIRGQGVHLKDTEINAIIEHAKSQGLPPYDDDVVKPASHVETGGSASIVNPEWLGDRIFHEAVQSMYRYNRTGADFFRRKLNIGYNQATRYVEQLEGLGYLSPQEGTAPREIIRTWDEWIAQLKDSGVSWSRDDELYLNPGDLRS